MTTAGSATAASYLVALQPPHTRQRYSRLIPGSATAASYPVQHGESEEGEALPHNHGGGLAEQQA